MTTIQKLRLLVGILVRYGSNEGSRHYSEKYDLNEDGRINWADVKIVLDTPLCKAKKHGWGSW
jgi:hypothetical protein